MRLVLTGGGTGGHIYPAVAVVEALERENYKLDVLWLGVPGGPEEKIAAEKGWQFGKVSAGQVRGAGWRAPLAAVRSIAYGVIAARSINRFRADAVMATGGYVSVPPVIGAWLARKPVLLVLPDVEPGWAVRFSQRFANLIAVSSDRSRRYLPEKKVRVTGYPVREAFFSTDETAARKTFALDDRRCVLVTGGSLGARSLNQATLIAAKQLAGRVQWLHVSGRRNYEEVRAQAEADGLSEEMGYHLFSYLENLPVAMKACDLVISRSGASPIGELAAAGKPGVLVPYPHSGAHQKENARYLADAGAAVLLDDATVGMNLANTISELLQNDAKLAEMARCARSLAKPNAAGDIAALLVQLTGVA